MEVYCRNISEKIRITKKLKIFTHFYIVRLIAILSNINAINNI